VLNRQLYSAQKMKWFFDGEGFESRSGQGLWWEGLKGELGPTGTKRGLKLSPGEDNPASLIFLFLSGKDSGQFFLGDKTSPVKLQGFHFPFVRTPSGGQHQEQGRYENAVDLNADPGGRLGQPMAAGQHGFDPFEKELDLPAVAIDQPDQVGRQVRAGGGQKKLLSSRLDADNAQDGAAAALAQFLHPVGNDPGFDILGRQGAGRPPGLCG
jgi:hypothetical protein